MTFDLHQHLRDPDDPEELALRLELMDANGIDRAVAMPRLDYDLADGLAATRAVNDGIAGFRDRHAERFPFAVGTVEPRFGEAGTAELERLSTVLGVHAVVWHHRFQGGRIDMPIMGTLLEACADLGLLVFVHTVATSNLEAPWRLVALADRHPDVRFVALAGFSSFEQGQWVVENGGAATNVTWELSLMQAAMRLPLVEGFVGRWGADRLTYGTDLYVSSAAYTTYRHHDLADEIRASDLSGEQKQRILVGNAERLLGSTTTQS